MFDSLRNDCYFNIPFHGIHLILQFISYAIQYSLTFSLALYISTAYIQYMYALKKRSAKEIHPNLKLILMNNSADRLVGPLDADETLTVNDIELLEKLTMSMYGDKLVQVK